MTGFNEERVREIAKCENSAAYFVENYGWIRHPKLGPIRFTLWPWQEAALDLWQAGKSSIFNKSRQVGATWTAIGFLSWLINFHPEIDTLVLSSKEEKAIKLLKKFYFFQDHVPDWLRARQLNSSKTNYNAAIRYWDEGKQKWVDGVGTVSSLTTTGTSGAGDTARFVLVDEFALMSERGHDREVYAAIAPTTTHGGQMVILSTPRGSFGEFYRIWTESVDDLVDAGITEEGLTDYNLWNRMVVANADKIEMVPMIAHYAMGHHNEDWLERNTRGISKGKADAIREHFGKIVYDTAWRDAVAKKLKLSKPQIMQEFELIFESMGNAAFNSEDINACRVYPERDRWVQDLINASTYFYIGVDTAEGIKVDNPEPDYNSICVFNEYGVQVFALNNREGIDDWAGSTVVDPATKQATEMPGTVLKVINQFLPCTVVVEKNGPGLTVQNRVEPHLPDEADMLVLSMTGGIKPQLVSDFAAEMADEQAVLINGKLATARRFLFTDQFTVRCLRQYIKTAPGKFSAAIGFYDDAVVSALWAAYAKRVLGARDGIAIMPSRGDEARPIAVEKADDLTREDLGGYGPAVLPQPDMDGVAVNPYITGPDEDVGLGLTPRSLGGSARSLEGRRNG